MSISVDDLVAAFGQNHINQEALDIQALHAQLAQALAAPQSQVPTRGRPNTCTTPTVTASSFPLAWGASNRPSGAASTPAVDADADDERMVEDLLMSAGPASPSLGHTSPYASAPGTASQYTSLSNDASSFATSDPFYLAMLAQQQQQAASPIAAGFFANAGRTAQASPFMRTHHHQYQYQQPQRQQSTFAAFPQTMPQPAALFAFDG